MEFREEGVGDSGHVRAVVSAAFPTDAEALLVRDLAEDASARPMISLLAIDGSETVGHVLFTRCVLEDAHPTNCMLLAPLAVLPSRQGRGIGTALMKRALELARERGIQLVFVLGHPGYYPRAGFLNDAGRMGLEPPFPIAAGQRDAWMVRELTPGIIGRVRGKVRSADALMRPEYWRE